MGNPGICMGPQTGVGPPKDRQLPWYTAKATGEHPCNLRAMSKILQCHIWYPTLSPPAYITFGIVLFVSFPWEIKHFVFK